MRVYICGNVRGPLGMRVATTGLHAILVNLGNPVTGRIDPQYVTALTRSTAPGSIYGTGCRVSRNGIYLMSCDLDHNFLGSGHFAQSGGFHAQVQIISPTHPTRYVRGTASGRLADTRFDVGSLINMVTGTDPVATAFSAYNALDEGPGAAQMTEDERQNMGADQVREYLERQIEGAEQAFTRLQRAARAAHGMAGMVSNGGRIDITVN